MRALLLLPFLVLAAGVQADDPLKSADCRGALGALDAARAARSGNVEPLRSRASAVCLGAGGPPGRAARALQAPVAVPPPTIEVPSAPQRVTVPARPQLPPPVAIERAPTVTACDAAGCWVQDGARLRHLPPALVGPGGFCAGQPGLAHCP
jgi:hypothetical protein